MKKFILLSSMSCQMLAALAQVPPLAPQWDYRYGGDFLEYFTVVQQTPDHGLLLGGNSWSSQSGNISQPDKGYYDSWIVKTDSLGIIQWDKRYGNNRNDQMYSAEQLPNGHYIIGAETMSDSGNDVSQPPAFGSFFDVWMFELDSAGTKLWDRRFGGEDNDELRYIHAVPSGYILAGGTRSLQSGDVSQPPFGTTPSNQDYWLLKTDLQGNKLWDKRYGGGDWDYLQDVALTSDGGFLLAGFTHSTNGYTITQPSQGGNDFWILKVDSAGIVQWDKRFGGAGNEFLNNILATPDGGFFLRGSSSSDSTGDVSHHTHGNVDYWLVKIDSVGNKQWDKLYGGSNQDGAQNVGFTSSSMIQLSDGNFLMSDFSYSNSGGDKSENNLGVCQPWIIKIDSLGNKIWDKTVFTMPTGSSGLVMQTYDGCFISGNQVGVGAGGYVTQSGYGWNDYWIVKLCDTTVATATINHSVNVSGISVYPDPFASEITISIQEHNLKQATFAIKNIFGQTVYLRDESNFSIACTKTIDLSFLLKGIYLLDVIIDGERTVKKIVKE